MSTPPSPSGSSSTPEPVTSAPAGAKGAGGRPVDRGRWALRDRPGVVWLVLAALLALVHPFVPESRWLMVHLVLLGAVTHSIVVWSNHFADALLKTGGEPRSLVNRRLVLLIVGVLAVLVGVPTALWPVTVAGATLASLAVAWHGWSLWRRLRHALPGRFRVTIRYYLAAAACMVLGAGLGATLARGLTSETHGRVLLAHTMVMVLGWVGLTVTGTLLTLWPTMLRTRMDERAESLARQALPALVISLLVVVAGALGDVRPVAVAGLVGYALAVGWWGRALLRPARTAPPRHFGTWSVTAALAWFAVALVLVPVRVAAAGSWAELGLTYGRITSVVTVGFALQLVMGALAHLVPVVLGGGASVVRVAQERLDRWGVLRVATVNIGLVLSLLPVPSAVRVLLTVLVLAALVSFVPLLLGAIRAAVRTRVALAGQPRGLTPLGPEATVWSPGQLVAAVGAMALAVSLGVAWDPAAAGVPVAAGGSAAAAAEVTPTGETTEVVVEAHDMRFSPSSITVPAGNTLVIELVNVDDRSPHDLVFASGARSSRVAPGARERIEVGVVGASTQAWCSVVGHRQMGMVLDVVVEGAGGGAGVSAVAGSSDEAGSGDGHGDGHQAGPSPADTTPSPTVSPDDSVSEDFEAVPAGLPPLTDETVRRVTLTIKEVELEVAPGVRQKRWTFDGAVPGPTLHGRVGDRFEVTLVNEGTMGHSIDFHAGSLAPDEPMRTIPPGESLVYEFTAERAGIWMYHCSTMPMSAHIAAGMHGAVVIEPPGLPEVERSYLLVQSEVHLDGDGRSPVVEVDAPAVAADAQPDLMTFNGIAHQYDHRPLTARVGERVRIWVLDAGPNRPSSLHVVGGQLDTVYAEGGYLLRRGRDAFGTRDGGSQALALQPAQGGFVELVLPEAGTYPVVTHVMADAERGAHALLRVTS